MQIKEIERISDIIDLSYLQQIQDSLGNIMGVTMAILGPDGVPLSRPTNLRAFCEQMQQSEQGLPMCVQANQRLIAENVRTHAPSSMMCPNSGLMTASVPIFLGDQFLGSWLIGQIRMEDVNLALVTETAQAAGLDEADAVAAISSLPITTRVEFDKLLDFLTTVTNTLTDMVRINHSLNERNVELIKTTRQLDRSLKTFYEFINIADIGMYLVDYESLKIIMYNDAYRKLFDKTHEELEGASCYELMDQNCCCAFCPKERLLGPDGEPGEPVVWENYNEVTDKWLQMTSRALYWIDGRMTMMTTFVDITERKAEEQRIVYLAYHDQLLNIYNNVKLFVDLQSASASRCQMICFDVVGLREINNVYGREAGDSLLFSIAAWMQEFTNEKIDFYRLQGDDFALLLRDCPAQLARDLTRILHERFESAWIVTVGDLEQNMYIGAHVGLIDLEPPPASFADLLNLVEQILSYARESKRPILYDEKLRRKDEADMRLRLSLKACVLNGMQGFSLNYQPLVDVATGKWTRIEALCRWDDPETGAVPPTTFIPEAEKLGLIRLISDWMFEESIRQVKQWGLDTLPDFVLDVNISPIELRDRGLLPKVLGMLKRHDYPSDKLSLEITETAEVHFDERTMEFLRNVRAAGISFTLDDFGIGYATFSSLKNLPVSVLKTDRSFIQGIEYDTFLQHTMRTMVELAQAADLLVVAEGVETEAQRRIVTDAGVNLIQGYYYSRPLTKEDMEANLILFY